MIKCSLFLFLIFFTNLLFSQTLLPIEKNNKWGLINLSGKVVVNPTYEQSLNLNIKNEAIAVLDGKYGVINSTGKVILPFTNQELMWLNDSLIASRKDSLWGVLRKNGKWLIPAKYREVGMMDDFIKVFSKGKQGIFSTNGKMIIAPVLFKVVKKKHFFIVTDKRMKSGLFAKSGKELVNISCDSIEVENDSLCFYKNKKGWGVVYKTQVSNTGAKHIYPLNDQTLALKSSTSNLYFAFSLVHQKAITDSIFSNMLLYDNEYIIASKGKNYAVFSVHGKLLFEKETNKIQYLGNHLFAVKNAESRYDIFDANKQITHPLNAVKIDRFVFAVSSFKIDSTFGVVNSQGKILFKPIYSNIEIGEGYMKLFKNEVHELAYFDESGDVKEVYNNVHSIKLNHQKPKLEKKGYHHVQFGCNELISSEYVTIKERVHDIYTFKNHCDQNVINKEHHFYDIRLTDFEESEVAFCWLENGLKGLVHKNGAVQMAFLHQNKHYYLEGRNKPQNGFSIIKLNINKNHIFPRKQNSLGDLNYNEEETEEVYSYAVINKEGKIVIPPDYKLITSLGSNYFILKNKDNSEFMSDSSGKALSEIYNLFEKLPFNDSLYIVGTSKREVGIISINGDVILDCNYEDVHLPSEGEIAVKKNGKWGYVNEFTYFNTPFEYDEVLPFSNGLAAVKKDKKWGFIDSKFKLQLGFLYDHATKFSHHKALVQIKSDILLINKQGEIVKNIEGTETHGFEGANAWVRKDHLWGLIDTLGNWVVNPKYKKVSKFSHGVDVVENESGSYLFVNRKGAKVSSHTFDKVEEFKNGFSRVKQNGLYGLMDTLGDFIIHCKYHEISDESEGVVMVKDENGKRFFVDLKEVKKPIPIDYDNISHFSDGLAIAKKGKEIHFVNTKGLPELVIPASDYEPKGSFSESKILMNEKWTGNEFFLHRTGEISPATFFTEAMPFENGVAIVKKDYWGIISETGTLLVDYQYAEIEPFAGKSMTKFYSANKYGIIDQKGNIIVDVQAEKIESINNKILKIETQNSIRYFNIETKKYIW